MSTSVDKYISTTVNKAVIWLKFKCTNEVFCVERVAKNLIMGIVRFFLPPPQKTGGQFVGAQVKP